MEPVVPSPCISVCHIEIDGFCAGCKRTVHEIATWPYMSNEEKLNTLELLGRRKPAS